jgi:CheY-like chemotaxis protein
VLEEPDNRYLFEEDEQKRMSINLTGLLPKILVVEDNMTNRRLVRLFLRKLGHDSDEAENGFEGVEKAQAKRYDVIFMDLEMPGMDGYEATRLIRHLPENGHAYIVALTAHALPEFRRRSLQAGMNAYLSKPVRQADLKQALREALRP